MGSEQQEPTGGSAWRNIVREAEDALDRYLSDDGTMTSDERIGFKAGYRSALAAPARSREEVERLRNDLKKHADGAQVAGCESCQAPLYEGDDFVSDPDGECSGCWHAMTDLPSKRERPCYAYRVGKPDARLCLSNKDTTNG